MLRRKFEPMLDLPTVSKREANAGHHKRQVSANNSQIPQMQYRDDESQYFRRVQIDEPIKHIDDIEEAFIRLQNHKQDPAANLRVGIHFLQVAEGLVVSPTMKNPIPFLKAAFPEGGEGSDFL